jgi:hypothetical protein
LITITAASSYQPAIIVHHHSCFAPPTGGDNVLLITAASPYEPAVKTFSLPAYCRIRRYHIYTQSPKLVVMVQILQFPDIRSKPDIRKIKFRAKQSGTYRTSGQYLTSRNSTQVFQK